MTFSADFISSNDARIPSKYRHWWIEGAVTDELHHITSEENHEKIKKCGYIEPRDPLYEPYWEFMLPHFKAKVLQYKNSGSKNNTLIRLIIKPDARLFRSVQPERTSLVMSLDPVPYSLVERVEKITITL